MRLTTCECTQEGWCERHQCQKSRGEFLLCQRSQDAFQQWGTGTGIGQPNPKVPQLEVLKTPCLHRSSESTREIRCQLCGSRHKLVPVHGCKLFGECTQFPTGAKDAEGNDIPFCLRCQAYSPNQTLSLI